MASTPDDETIKKYLAGARSESYPPAPGSWFCINMDKAVVLTDAEMQAALAGRQASIDLGD